MDGIILTYNTNIPSEITNINNKLFGRVVKIRRNNNLFLYYYDGILHNINYFKLSNGSYFISNRDNLNCDWLKINIYKATISIKQKQLITARQYFRNKYLDQKVRNLE